MMDPKTSLKPKKYFSKLNNSFCFLFIDKIKQVKCCFPTPMPLSKQINVLISLIENAFPSFFYCVKLNE